MSPFRKGPQFARSNRLPFPQGLWEEESFGLAVSCQPPVPVFDIPRGKLIDGRANFFRGHGAEPEVRHARALTGAEDVWVAGDLLVDGWVHADGDDAVTAVGELLADDSVVRGLGGVVVEAAVNEDADPREAVAFVEEVGLDEDFGVGAVLREIRKPQATVE